MILPRFDWGYPSAVNLNDAQWGGGVPVTLLYYQSYDNDVPTLELRHVQTGATATVTPTLLATTDWASFQVQLRATLPATMRAVGQIQIVASNRAGRSAPVVVTVNPAAPVITSISPGTISAGVATTLDAALTSVTAGESLTLNLREANGTWSTRVVTVNAALHVSISLNAQVVGTIYVSFTNGTGSTSNQVTVAAAGAGNNCGVCAPVSSGYRDTCYTVTDAAGTHCNPANRGFGWCTCGGIPW